MCLQWCHVRGWVIDNDLPCRGCAAYGESPVGSCATCRHRREGAGGPLCSLTRQGLPYAGGCCHHNAAVTVGEEEVIAVDALPVAPWVLEAYRVRSAAELVAEHHSAPEPEQRDGRRVVRIGDLAVPFVYGVTADAWEDAVALPEDGPIPDEPPHVAVAIAALEALADGGAVGEAYDQLMAVLEVMPLETVPEHWRGTILETLNLLEAHLEEDNRCA